jgi:hypothetical protein
MWLDYIDEEAFATAMELYNAANTAPTFEEYISNIEQLTTLVQDECLAMGGLQVMRMYGIQPNFAGVYIQPITGYYEFCYLWDTEA